MPLLLGAHGRLNADTKQELYLDPAGLLRGARHLWDDSVAGGTVTHQAVGYLWPMGPFFRVGDALGIPDWATQRLWIGGLQLFAALGALVLYRALAGEHKRGQLVCAAGYGLSPYLLGHAVGQSALLLPFAGFGWMVLCLVRGLVDRRWRWPAAFALLVGSCGSLNGSSVFLVVVGAAMWVPFGVRAAGVPVRVGVSLLLRSAALTVLASLWWLVPYSLGGRYGLPILQLTETVDVTSATTSAPEVLRGLGYWFAYGGDPSGLWLDGLSTPYMSSPAVLLASFALPVGALALASRLRWKGRAYFASLIAVGTLMATVAFSAPWRSPAGAAFAAASERFDLVLSLRNTQRAGPLVALGSMGLLAAGLAALHEIRPSLGRLAATAVALGVALSLPAQWRDGLIAERFHREEVPAYWRAVGAALDHSTGTVLELPGMDFASYRWGHTLDSVLPSLTERPVIGRELIPRGGPVGISILEALDRSLQEGWYEAAAIAPMARLLGAGAIVVRNDLEYERYRTIRPTRLWAALQDPAADLGRAQSFGTEVLNLAAPRRPLLDEVELGLDPPEPLPPVAVLEVAGGTRPPLAVRRTASPTIVEGSGDGLYAAAAAGLLEGRRGPLLVGADLAREGTADDLVGPGARWIITDSNRRQAQHWYGLAGNLGGTEPPGGARGATDERGRLDLVEDLPEAARTTVTWTGAEAVWGTGYGGAARALAEDRPVLAFDGDPSTAWRVDAAVVDGPYVVGVDAGREVEATHVDLVQPQRRPGTESVLEAVVTLDGDRDRRFTATFGRDGAMSGTVTRVGLDGRPFHQLEVELTHLQQSDGLVGLGEVIVPGLEVREVVQLPTAMLDRLGGEAGEAAVALVVSRQRVDPADPVRADPEAALRRRVDLPAPMQLRLSGAARLHPGADDAAVEALLGAVGPTLRASESLPGSVRSRAAAALDGDLGTAWTTPFVGLVGQVLQVETETPVSLDRLELDVIADARHSTPSRLGVSFDGGPVDVLDIPPVPEPARLGGTRRLQLPLPAARTGSAIRITIEGAYERTTADWYSSSPVALPVAVAELRLPGVPNVTIAERVDAGCRYDLLTIDGVAVPLLVAGTTRAAVARDALEVATCDGLPLSLSAGHHDLEAAPGTVTALDLDRLVLRTAAWDEDPVIPEFSSPAVSLTTESSGHVAGQVEVGEEPVWVVLDQNPNDGWHLDARDASGASLATDGPHPIDGSAAGWLVRPSGPGPITIDARWTPQRAVDRALMASLATAALSLLLIAWPRRSGPADVGSPALPPPSLERSIRWSTRRSIAAALAVGVAVLVFVHPLLAIPAAVAALVSGGRPGWRRAAPPVLVAIAAYLVLAEQVGRELPPGPRWPAEFPWAHVLALLAVIVLGVDAILDKPRTEEARTDVTGSGL